MRLEEELGGVVGANDGAPHRVEVGAKFAGKVVWRPTLVREISYRFDLIPFELV